MSAQKDFHLGNNPLKIVIVAINVAGGKGGAGAVFIMTEPTVSGKHDMERDTKPAAPLNIDTVKLRLKT